MKRLTFLTLLCLASQAYTSEYTQGLLAINQQDWNKAAKHLELSFEEAGQNKSEIALLLAQLDQKYLTQDRLYYALVADKDSNLTNSQLQRIIADLSFKEANLERAEKYYQKILENNDSLSEYARYQLAWVKVNQGQVVKSVELLSAYDYKDPASTLQAPIARDLGRFAIEAIESSPKYVLPSFNLGGRDNQKNFIEGLLSGLNRSKTKDKFQLIKKLQTNPYFPGVIAQFTQKKSFEIHCQWASFLEEEKTKEAATWFGPDESLIYLQQCNENVPFSLALINQLAINDDYIRQAALHALTLEQKEKGCHWLIKSMNKNIDSQGLILAAQKCSLSQKQIQKYLLPHLSKLSSIEFAFILEKFPKETMAFALKNNSPKLDEQILQLKNIDFLAKTDAEQLKQLLMKSPFHHLQWISFSSVTGDVIPKAVRETLLAENFSSQTNEKDFDLWAKYFFEHKNISVIDWSKMNLPKDHQILKNMKFISKAQALTSSHESLVKEVTGLKNLLSEANKEKWFHRSLYDQARAHLKEKQVLILKRLDKEIESSADPAEKNQLTLIYQAVEKIIEERTT